MPNRRNQPRDENSTLVRELLQCCRGNDFSGAKARYETLRTTGIKPDINIFLAILALCCGTLRRSSQHEPKGRVWSETLLMDDDEPEQSKEDLRARRELASNVFEYMAECGVQATEAAYTMLIRCYCLDEALDDALKVFEELKSAGCTLKVRSLAPMLRVACRLGRVETATELRDLATANSLSISEADHIALLEASRDPSHLSEMARDIFTPSRGAWDPVARVMEERGFAATRDVTVSAEGICPSCKRTLRSIDLTQQERDLMLQQIDGLVVATPAQQGNNGNSPHPIHDVGGKDDVDSNPCGDADRRAVQWKTFRRWLNDKRFDAVIDGANVGYYNNHVRSSDVVDFRQIDLVLRHCINLGKKTLIVLHARHLADDRLARSGSDARDIIRSWRRGGHLYSCSLRNNDDWYWLCAAMQGGDNAILISNDEMRDHHFGMLSRRAFLVWKERHLTKFTFGPWSRAGGRLVELDMPTPFSVRMQYDDFSWHIPTRDDQADLASANGSQQQVLSAIVRRPVIANVRWLCLHHKRPPLECAEAPK